MLRDCRWHGVEITIHFGLVYIIAYYLFTSLIDRMAGNSENNARSARSPIGYILFESRDLVHYYPIGYNINTTADQNCILIEKKSDPYIYIIQYDLSSMLTPPSHPFIL